MFDIHIFTLYSLNQTILKKVEKKGKGQGHGSHWNQCHPPHCINYVATRYGACWETGTPQMDNGLHTLGFATVLFFIVYLCLELCIFLLVRLPASGKSRKQSLTMQVTLRLRNHGFHKLAKRRH